MPKDVRETIKEWHECEGFPFFKGIDIPFDDPKYVHTAENEKELLDEYNTYNEKWSKSGLDGVLETVFMKKHNLFKDLKITKCICMGLGIFADEYFIPKADVKEEVQKEFPGRGTHYKILNHGMAQLVFFEKVVNLLRKQHKIEFVGVQDPLFEGRIEEQFIGNVLGWKLLKAKGDSGVKTDQAMKELKISDTTFLYAPNLDIDVLAEALAANWPRLYVGNRVDGTASELAYPQAYKEINNQLGNFLKGTNGEDLFDIDGKGSGKEFMIRWPKK